MVELRPAKLSDAEAIAHVHVHVWRETMRELASPSVFAALDEEHRLRYWTKKLSEAEPHQLVLVAEIGQEIVGIGAVGQPSDPIFGSRAEIKNLYVLASVQRQGIGKRLLGGLATHAKAMGYRSAGLSVVKGNEPACRFYEALHACKIGEFRDPGPIWRSDNIVYAWDDLDQLITQ
ncbi:ribosomal protein S18 acetylase RimI-like enzyme [Agrobacterium larrymoorei]|uniref:Ribosomal protein S18 acetylase RimI-like enzyme n=1 Tax=Agrobacterium larrymoorei TaxID=160699 RepID=A0AAJ2BDM5_9HYPH|nr:GNAT family N-acetyltransferase [Agrobacterium larrymoorei]MDR6102857.1 ribosomal protein S18 acetylase RimI-like enzyme [Agrobacterium larrymoorei]